MEKKSRNGIVDWMRFVFSMVIVIFHGRNLGGTPEIALFADAGYIGVEFFFLVSGFLMAHSAARKQGQDCTNLGIETIQFIWRKIKPMLAFYIFAVIFAYGHTVITEEYTLRKTVTNLLMGVWDFAFLRASGIKTVGLVRATWYLSAMLIAMLALYPMIRRWKDTFVCIIAPLIAIFFLGYVSQNFGNLNQYVKDYRLIYSGVMRAMAELSLGCIGYAACEKIKTVRFTTISRVLITLAQVIGYAGVIYCTTSLPAKQFDFVMLLCLAICVPLSFSGQGIAAPLFRGALFPWLGKLSLVIYLNHMWVKDTLAGTLPKAMGYWKLLVIYICCVLVVSLICLLWAEGLRVFWSKCGKRIQGWFLLKTEQQ